jgi:hypothetical protein
MTIEQVVAQLETEGGNRGATATPGHADYERARNLDFTLCECSRRHGTGHDYIARTPRGAYLYVGINGRTHVISCGPKGYHFLTGTAPCI